MYGYTRENRPERYVKYIQEREGNITIEYFGEPDNFFTDVDYTIEITDELIARGREKYGHLPRRPIAGATGR